MNTTAYKIYVMSACEARQVIEIAHKGCLVIFTLDIAPEWDWQDYDYRIKLPEGWEYVIEEGEIAFRSPQNGEHMLIPLATTYKFHKVKNNKPWGNEKYPIIKKVKK